MYQAYGIHSLWVLSLTSLNLLTVLRCRYLKISAAAFKSATAHVEYDEFS